VKRDNRALVVEHERTVLAREPLAGLGRVVVWGGVEITTAALRLLARAGVRVALLTSRGRYVASLAGPLDGTVALRLAQLRRYADPAFALAQARATVRDKLAAQTHLLREARKRAGPDALKTAVADIESHLPALDAATEADVVRGLEGIAARTYFDALGTLVPEPFRFDGRNRRPPRDPVNALLSLGYTLLANEIAGDLEARGLDPRLGFFHTLRAGRPALALDVLDPWRPAAVDRLVLTLLRRRVFRPEHFRQAGDAVLLTPEALKAFLAAYDRHLGAPEAADTLRRRIAAYVDHLESRLAEDLP
jgi:CRISPR-associated protein Cas1